ncbi:YeiH family putative sulfate export transporter [Sporosarcina sp. Marseille-Q4063]|uniref:YeiH family protein n=1 Tax=Sporosarcina sp. Marseille-Q4063 TaxID=2810514 RepID=UPI001BB0CC1B|nr:YeiH family protein [Sporosarcina sp. Marseille-Q4063]QUW20861.1 YeiH family putative sulfate export transporter [Sporosarcina sp. Marseille-Q4063]
MKKEIWKGIGLTFFIAIIAKLVSSLPYLSLIGPLVLAILIGILWNTFLPVQATWEKGITFSSKMLLRIGIILLGMRLNLSDIAEAGWPALLLAVCSVIVGIVAVYGVAKLIRTDYTVGFLTACGTGICGAAAIVAISSQMKAKPEETAVSVVVIAVLGTIFTVAYSVFYPVLGLSSEAYGMFAGGTLHEIAHVVAAGDVGGKSALDLALVVKLTRVMLLVFVASGVGIWMARKNRVENEKFNFKKLPIPWFIFGFLATSALYSTGIIPEVIASKLVTLAYVLMAMAMAGLGLNVKFDAFRQAGIKPFIAGLVGSLILVVTLYFYIQ